MKLWISRRIISLLFVRPPCRIHLFNIRTFPSGKLESLAGSWVYTNLRASSETLTYIDPDWFVLLSEFGSRFSTVNKLCIHDKKTQKHVSFLNMYIFIWYVVAARGLIFESFYKNGSFTEFVSVWIVCLIGDHIPPSILFQLIIHCLVMTFMPYRHRRCNMPGTTWTRERERVIYFDPERMNRWWDLCLRCMNVILI